MKQGKIAPFSSRQFKFNVRKNQDMALNDRVKL